jgi:hypothetical protein
VSGPAPIDPRARSPEATLRALGLQCTVETRGNLAVVIPAPGERTLEDVGIRRAVLAALREHGFTHAAVELRDDTDPAAADPRAQ